MDPTYEKIIVRMIDLASGESQKILNGTKCRYLSRNGSGAICFGQKDVTQFDPTNGAVLKTFSFDTEIRHAVTSPDGRSLAVIERDSVILLDTQSGQEVKRISFESFESMAAILIRLDETDHYVVAISNQTGLVQIIDLASGAILRKVQMSESGINGMSFSPDRTTLASIDENSVLRLWNFKDDIVTHVFGLATQKAGGPLVFSPNGLKLAFNDAHQSYTYELDIQTGSLKGIEGYPAGFTSNNGWYSYTSDSHLVTWGFEGDFMAAGAEGVSLTFNDLSAETKIVLPFKMVPDFKVVESMALSPDGNYLATGFPGAEISIWNLDSQELVQTLVGHDQRWSDGWIGAILQLVFNPQNDLLVSIGWDGTTRLWNIRSGLQLQKLNVCCYAEFSPDGRILVTLGEGVLRVWGVPPWP
jgi:WD40 repeat protein